MEISAVDVPVLGSKPVRAAELSPRVAQIFCDPSRWMLRDPEEAREKCRGIQSYEDPVLKDKFLRLVLARRLWYGSMLTSSKERKGDVSFFSVIKKVVELNEETEDRRDQFTNWMAEARALWEGSGTRSAKPPTRSGKSPGTGRSGSGRSGTSSKMGGRLHEAIPVPIPSTTGSGLLAGGSPSRSSCGSRASGSTTRCASPKCGAILRIVIDERSENPKWEDPEKATLSSPESVSALDFSPQSLHGGAVAMWKGDIPHYYYRLAIEQWQAGHFCLGDLKVSELDRFLELLGEPITGLSPDEYLAMGVLVMGWNWSVWAAETVAEDVFSRGVEILKQSCRLCHGRPTPRISPWEPDIWATHIDDGFGWTWGPSMAEALKRAGMVKEAVRTALEDVGLGFHKEEVGEKLDIVGLEVGRDRDGAYRCASTGAGMASTRDFTWDCLEQDMRGGVTKNEMEKVMGLWAFRCLPERAGFAVFKETYRWIKETPRGTRRRLWKGVRAELRVAIALSALFFSELSSPWSTLVPAVDAAKSGFAVVGTQASLEEVMEESRWAEQKGWFSHIHCEEEEKPRPRTRGPSFVSGETTIGLPRGSGSGLEQSGAAMPNQPGRAAIPNAGTGHAPKEVDDGREGSGVIAGDPRPVLFLGPPGSPGPAALRAAGIREVHEFSSQRGVKGLGSGLRAELMSRATTGSASAIIIEMGWEGFFPQDRGRSGKRTKRRSRLNPSGVSASDRTAEENEAVNFVARLAQESRRTDTTFLWLHPENSLAWKLPEVLKVAGTGTFELVDGAPLAFRAGGSEKYRVLTGARWFRGEVARPSKRWGLGLNEGWSVLASTLNRHLRLQGWESRERSPGGGKRRGPALAAGWGDPGRWKVWIRGKWRHDEHSNVLEGRTTLMAARNLCRRSQLWGTRSLIITDNQASAGAFSKGRSSSHSFGFLCRRFAAIKLSTGCGFALRYVETFRNPADGPSRGQPWAGVYGTPAPRPS